MSANNIYIKNPGFARTTISHPDSRIVQAERTVYTTYGDEVSTLLKGKALNKWGKNATVSTNWETIQEFQGSEINETFPSTNAYDYVVSSSNSDVGLILSHEGHTIDGSGNLTFNAESVTLNGQTPVALTTAKARTTRAFVKDSGVFNSPQSNPVGTVYFYNSSTAGGVTSGVPNTASATGMVLSAGDSQSQKCSTSLSQYDYYFVSYWKAVVGEAASPANYIDVRLEKRNVADGGVWRPIATDLTIFPDLLSSAVYFDPLLIVPKNHDIRVRAKTDTSTASVYAEFGGFLAVIQT